MASYYTSGRRIEIVGISNYYGIFNDLGYKSVISLVFALFSLVFFYKRNNPLRRALFFLFSLLFVIPIMRCLNSSIYVFLFALIFSRGILVLRVYFCSLVTYNHTPTVGGTLLFFSCLLLLPLLLGFSISVFISTVLLNQF